MIKIKKIFFLVFILPLAIFAKFNYETSKITPQIKNKMIKGKSWKKSCPVSFTDLRYLRLTYIDFRGIDVRGEIIVHKEISSEVIALFEALYDAEYPIKKMRLVSYYKGNDWQSIEAGNTSAFNCRSATGSKKWSKHSYGKAIDINPIQNPYIFRSGYISHKASLRYRKRVHTKSGYADKAILLKDDKATKIFKSYGWRWGGDFSEVKDYQHFSK